MIDDAVTHWGRSPWPGGQVLGDPGAHLDSESLVDGLAALAPPPSGSGLVHAVVCRQADEQRTTPGQVRLCPDRGVIGDRWIDGSADPQMQVALMRVDVAHLVAGGQHPAFFGDNILVDMDLSVDQMPPGIQLRVGTASCVVAEAPHNPCNQFASRFGMAAFRLVADKRWQADRLRGVYLQVVSPGVVAPGDRIEVLERR
jgi:hypothetical protein